MASLVISRAGSTIFEIASWGMPSIIMPLPSRRARPPNQKRVCLRPGRRLLVIEQQNLTPGLLVSEVNRILGTSL